MHENKTIFLLPIVNVKISGGRGLTYIKQMKFTIFGLRRFGISHIPMSSLFSTFGLTLQNTSDTPVITVCLGYYDTFTK